MFVLDFGVSFLFLVVGLLTLVAAGLVGWLVAGAIVVGTAIVVMTPFGHHLPLLVCALMGIVLGGIAVVTAELPGYITFGVVCLGAVLVLLTPNGGNFMLMGMAVISLVVAVVTVWAAALAILGLDTPA